MTWQKWALIGFYALNILVTIAMIGKQRKPIDPGTAVVSVLISAGLVALVVTA